MSIRPTYMYLMLAGTLPFLACALLPLAGVESVRPFGRLDYVSAVYGLGILSFLTGIHWATQLVAPERTPFDLMIASNVVFLAVWFAFIAANLNWALAAQLLAFPLLLAVDVQLAGTGLLSRHYLRMRFIATALACFSQLFILVN